MDFRALYKILNPLEGGSFGLVWLIGLQTIKVTTFEHFLLWLSGVSAEISVICWPLRFS